VRFLPLFGLVALGACQPAAKAPANPPDTTVVDTVVVDTAAPVALLAPSLSVRARTVYDTVFLPAPLPAGTDTVKVSTDTTRYTTWHTGRITDSTWLVVRTPLPAPTPAPAPTPTAMGVPFGPFALWSGTTPKWGPAPFTMSQNYSDPVALPTQIQAARSQGQRLVLAMTGGGKALYQTNGNFDLAKWKAQLTKFNTAAMKTAIAQGVADGTIIGSSLIDEPEHAAWGTGLSKVIVSGMAAYEKAIFPTLPVGVNHGAEAYYTWRPTERYTAVDYVQNNYVWRVLSGNITGYRDKVLAQARLDGVTPAFSLNILDGGVKIAGCTGTACCPLTTTGGIGTFAGAGGQNCRMTAANVRDWGKVLGPAGCALLMWQYDAAFFSKADNQQAFRDVATVLAATPRRSCRRP